MYYSYLCVTKMEQGSHILNSTTILSQYLEQPASLKMRGRWDHGYHHKYYKSKSFVDLAGSTCWKTCPNAVWGPT